MPDALHRRVIQFRFAWGALVECAGQTAQPWRVEGRRYEERTAGSGTYYGLALEGERHMALQWVSEADLRLAGEDE